MRTKKKKPLRINIYFAVNLNFSSLCIRTYWKIPFKLMTLWPAANYRFSRLNKLTFRFEIKKIEVYLRVSCRANYWRTRQEIAGGDTTTTTIITLTSILLYRIDNGARKIQRSEGKTVRETNQGWRISRRSLYN